MTIPVSFEYEGIQFDGTLEDALGGGSSFWLIINNYSYGQLVKQQPGQPGENLHAKWYFYPTKGLFEELAGYFGELVEKNRT